MSEGLCQCGCGQKTSLAERTVPRLGYVKGEPVRFIIGHASRGRVMSEDQKQAVIAAHKGIPRPDVAEAMRKRIGKSNPLWQGDDVGYSGVHKWLLKNKVRTGTCQHCGRRPKRARGGRLMAGTEFANLSGEYRRDPSDYVELCRPCHRKFDAKRRRR